MTRNVKKLGFKLASVESVAKDIVRGIENNRMVIYTPFKWMLIMKIIKHIPTVIFNKLDIGRVNRSLVRNR